jgi:hypothetical protein
VLYYRPFLTNSRINLIISVMFFADYTQNIEMDRRNRMTTHFFDVSRICSRLRDQHQFISLWMLSTSVPTIQVIDRHGRRVGKS